MRNSPTCPDQIATDSRSTHRCTPFDVARGVPGAANVVLNRQERALEDSLAHAWLTVRVTSLKCLTGPRQRAAIRASDISPPVRKLPSESNAQQIFPLIPTRSSFPKSGLASQTVHERSIKVRV